MQLQFITSELKEEYSEMLDELDYKRFLSGITSDIDIYPLGAKGSYRVYSYSEDREEPNVYHIKYTGKNGFVCGCEDYMYNVDTGKTKVARCKHVWRLWVEVAVGLLPPGTEGPYSWIKESVSNDVLNSISKSDENPEEYLDDELLRLREIVQSKDPREVDYQKAYSLWKSYKDIEKCETKSDLVN